MHGFGWAPLAALVLLACLLVASSPGFAQSVYSDGFEPPCDTADIDGDRLTGCQEVAYKTDPAHKDSDRDGLLDGDEVLGTENGLDLPGLGVDPLRKDLLVEHDWTDDALHCAPHSHRPNPAVMDELRQIFATAPVPNPDGSTGINLVNDYGQGGALAGGNHIALVNGSLEALYDAQYDIVKPANFAPNRRGYFHHMLHAHAYSASPGSTGQANLPGADSLITMACQYWDLAFTRNTILHELGHNLGLHHGGDAACNGKPNYNSVMNYRFSQFGVDADCDSTGDGAADFSDGSNVSLDENSLDESVGVCGATPVDWNYNGLATEAGLVVDLNGPEYLSANAHVADCGAVLSLLSDHDDWSALNLQVLPAQGGEGGGPQVQHVVSCPPYFD